MKNSFNPRMREGDEVNTEWSQASYEAWCRENAAQFITFPEKRVVDLYKVVRSVIENDFSPVEKKAAVLHWYKGLSVAAAAEKDQNQNDDPAATIVAAVVMIAAHVVSPPICAILCWARGG